MERLRIALLVSVLTACAADAEPRSVSDGEVHATLASPTGPVEPLDIVTPAGDVILERDVVGVRCELVVNATDPVAADHRSAAQARRTRLLVRVDLGALQDPQVATEQRAPARPGLLYGDCTVRVERANGDAPDDQYCSSAGTVVLEPLPAEEGRARVRLEGVELFDMHDRANVRRLDGVVDAVFRGGPCPP